MRIAISIDLGTTGCRACAYSAAGEVLGSHHVEYGLIHPEPGAAEQEAEGWWSAARACVQAVTAALPAPEKVVGIGISAQGHSWVPVGEDLRPLRPALTWLDTRAAGAARDLLRDRGIAFWGDRAGKAPGAWHTLPQIIWLREAEPRVERAAAHYLYAHDFLIARLTGKLATDYTSAAASLLFNIRQFQWDRGLAADYRVDTDRFAPVVPAGAEAAPLQFEEARDLRLPPGIPVAVGAQDQKCAALGAGLEDQCATVSLGTATAVTALARRPSFEPSAAIPCFPYLARNAWVLEAPLTTTGAALRWLRDLVRSFGAAGVDYDALSGLAAGSKPGAGGLRFLPFLAGAGAPHWSADARGAFLGLSLETSAPQMTRALLESVAFELRTNLDAMQEQGVRLERVVLFGGGARSDLWTQIIAGVTRLPVHRSSNVETAALGAAALAFSAAGVYPSPHAARVVIGGDYDLFSPDQEEMYEGAYRDYCAQRDHCLRHWGGGSR